MKEIIISVMATITAVIIATLMVINVYNAIVDVDKAFNPDTTRTHITINAPMPRLEDEDAIPSEVMWDWPDEVACYWHAAH